MALFEVKDIDKRIYEDELKDFLPDAIIDIHTHVHSLKHRKEKNTDRQVLWPALVARENTGGQLAETYRLMFPGKTVNHLSFCNANTAEDYVIKNEYVASEAKKHLEELWKSSHRGSLAGVERVVQRAQQDLK